MSQDDDATIERVARAIYEARPTVWAETREPTTMPSPAYETVTRPIPWLELVDGAESDAHYSGAVRETRHIARAALSALPERELLAEALEALQVFEKVSGVFEPHDWGGAAYSYTDDYEPFDMHETGDRVVGLTVGDLRRARAAADKIRAALTQEKQT